MGHQHQTGCQLAEQSPEQLYLDTVWGYNRSVHQGETISSGFCCSSVNGDTFYRARLAVAPVSSLSLSESKKVIHQNLALALLYYSTGE